MPGMSEDDESSGQSSALSAAPVLSTCDCGKSNRTATSPPISQLLDKLFLDLPHTMPPAGPIEEPGQFDDAPEDVNQVTQTASSRPQAAYIDTVDEIDENEWPPSSEEDEADEDSFDENEFYEQTRVEDEDWEVAEGGEHTGFELPERRLI